MAKILKQGATVAAILIAAIIALLGLYVVIAGVPQSYISVTGYINGTVMEETGMFQYHYIGGFFYASAAVMIIGGILYGKLRIAWIGLALLFVFSELKKYEILSKPSPASLSHQQYHTRTPPSALQHHLCRLCSPYLISCSGSIL